MPGVNSTPSSLLGGVLVGNLLKLLDKTELVTHQIRNLEKPGPFTAQSKMVVEIGVVW